MNPATNTAKMQSRYGNQTGIAKHEDRREIADIIKEKTNIICSHIM